MAKILIRQSPVLFSLRCRKLGNLSTVANHVFLHPSPEPVRLFFGNAKDRLVAYMQPFFITLRMRYLFACCSSERASKNNSNMQRYAIMCSMNHKICLQFTSKKTPGPIFKIYLTTSANIQ